MKWKKAPEALIARFRRIAPNAAGVQQRLMFGYPSCFLNGNMFAGLFQDRMVIRLGESDRINFLRLPDTAQFEPMPGRPMTEYVVVPPDMVDDDGAIRAWIARALTYATGLPPKAKVGGKTKAKSKSGGKTKAKAKPARAAKKPARRR